MSTFWRLVLKPGRKYSSNLNVSVHVTNAVIHPKSFIKCSFCTGEMFRCSGNCVFPIRYELDGKKLILCYLSEQRPDKNLDITFDEGSTLIFRNQSTATIYLTGHTVVDESWRPAGDAESHTTSSEEYDDFSSEEEDEETSVENLSCTLEILVNHHLEVTTKNTKVVDEESANGGEENFKPRYYDEFDEKDLSDADDAQNDRIAGTEIPAEDSNFGSNSAEEKNTVTPESNEEDPSNNLTETKVETPKTNESTPATQPAKIKFAGSCCHGCLIIEELERGDGCVAENGKEVWVCFVARSAVNNDGFEMKSGDLGYKFTLGEGRCVEGFERGLMGMKVGGRRRITCPSLLAYGSRGAPPFIPPDSDLLFDVELMSCK